MEKFKAFRVHTIDGKPVCKFEQLSMDDIDDGAVVIKVAYSAITYKDAMAARGVGKNVRPDRPCVTGVDLSGTVLHSKDPRFTPGDRVAVTNYQLGTMHDGAYADYARVPAEWVVPLPDSLSLWDAMVLGTSGLTAALAVDRFEKAGLKPGDGPIGISGATGGVGSLAINMLSNLGYEVIAISGKREQEGYLREIGASKIILREDFMKDPAPMVSGAYMAGAMDNVGGQFLDRLCANVKPHGKVAIAGMVFVDTKMTVLPFVLRSVDILGINVSRQLAMPERKRLWDRMGADLKPTKSDLIASTIPFEQLDSKMDGFFDVSTVGRIVVEVTEKKAA
ncbi:quinone oxidoreductase [Advenella kashmirensis W13003]|uniref:Quinone oxidoreductase n=1 Tax=Advenella kashmirensis W13003 TaxID=1424334 RepID=V8QXJ4_9BURK|nr:acryloyl-CoA reductase [Advenella kashmirensis]ETF04015.1 quinone oxidoreductase [Advenella kashmirensis W13003]